VSNLPFGITVSPSLLIEVYKDPAGADRIITSFIPDLHPEIIFPKTINRNSNLEYFILLKITFK
jgi:hypothetical protein